MFQQLTPTLSRGLFSFDLQSILNAANKLVFIIEESQYKGGLEGSIPVLIQSVSSYENY